MFLKYRFYNPIKLFWIEKFTSGSKFQSGKIVSVNLGILGKYSYEILLLNIGRHKENAY